MNGAEFIFLLQPTPRYKMNLTEEEKSRIRRKFKTKDTQRIYGQNEREFYDALRETEKPFQFVDLSNIFSEIEDTLYIDNCCHFNAKGYVLIVNEISRIIGKSMVSETSLNVN